MIDRLPMARLISALLAVAALLPARGMSAEPITVRYPEGLTHGFLTLRTLQAEPLAEGDLIQFSRGDQVTSRLLLHFRDGSLHEETVVFSQRGTFRMLRDHLVQKGPTFPHPIDVSTDGTTGQVTVRYEDEGKAKVLSERLDLPPDVATNGMVLTLIKNLRPDAAPTRVPIVAATPKPRLVTLVITSVGEEPFSIGASSRKATHYLAKVEIGGVAGLVAPLIGKQPRDSHVWILGGDAPAFVKSEGPLYAEGPSWRLELTNPIWPSGAAAKP